MAEIKPMKLSEIDHGAVDELWLAALSKVLENIDDPNTSWKDKRKITLEFTFSSDEERKVGKMEINCSTKIAGVKGVDLGVYFGRHEGRLAVVEAPKQESLFNQSIPKPRVVAAGESA